MQTAVVGTVATVGTATVGAMVVVWQIGKQARYAIEQNRNNESLKLKVQVYEEIVAVCRKTTRAQSELSSYTLAFQSDIAISRNLEQAGISWRHPKARVSSLLDKKRNFDSTVIEIISLTEIWEIIDPRIEIFRTAVNAAQHDIHNEWKAYFDVALYVMPQEIPQHPEQGTLFPWRPPDVQVAEQLDRLQSDLSDKLMDLTVYVMDYQLEMQNLLLGDLFKRRLPPRKPLDPELVVIELDNHAKLADYFENETDWGREKQRIERGARVTQPKND